MNIASSLNEYYLPYTYTMLYSLFKNNPGEKFNVFLLTDDLSDNSKDALQSLAGKYNSEISFLYPDRKLMESTFSGKTDWSMTACYRLVLNDLLPDWVDRILYLDGDLVVLQNIRTFYEMDFCDADMIAGRDLFCSGERLDDAISIHSNVFEKIIRDAAYFNSGVLLLNIEKMKRVYTFNHYREIIDKLNCYLPFPDQDILNYTHYGHVIFFDATKYNFQGMHAIPYNGGYDSARIRREVSILHFIDRKPWNGGDHIHYDAENIWWDYALKTPFCEDLLVKYLRGTMNEDVKNSFLELKHDNEQLQNEIKRVSLQVKKILENLSRSE